MPHRRKRRRRRGKPGVRSQAPHVCYTMRCLKKFARRSKIMSERQGDVARGVGSLGSLATRDELLPCLQCAVCRGWRVINPVLSAGRVVNSAGMVSNPTVVAWSCRLSPDAIKAHPCACTGPVRSTEEQMQAAASVSAHPSPRNGGIAPGIQLCTQCVSCGRWRPAAGVMPPPAFRCSLDLSTCAASQICLCARDDRREW